jgi:D-alanyl-D-alanine carboxypeptidase
MSAIFKSKRSGIFLLCIILATAIFVGVVCFVINDRNQKIINGDTLYETEKIEETENKENNLPVFNEEEVIDTTITYEEQLPIPPTPGTLNEPTIITIDDDNWNLTLVNTGYRIIDSYKPDLVYVCGSSERLDKKIAEHYEAMYNAAKEDGVTLTPCSGYRSYDRQKNNYNNKVAYYEDLGYTKDEALEKAATIIMPPGSSEHNLGYAMDIVCVDEWFEDTDEFNWLMENAQDYGFILRYPKDKQDITKVTYEPWHWRYVGVEHAKKMKATGQVLEEYLGAN